MGLDFSHCDAHWSYSGFSIFRRRICWHIGIIGSLLEDMYEDGSYKFLINDDIYPLIDHSDCDGELTIQEMKQIIPRLQNIIDEWRKDADWAVEYDIINSEYLINGMHNAIKAGESIQFH